MNKILQENDIKLLNNFKKKYKRKMAKIQSKQKISSSSKKTKKKTITSKNS